MTTTALVTGANRGLGRSIALALGQRGHAVAVGYRTDATGADATVRQIIDAGGRAATLRLDLADTESFPDVVTLLRSILASSFGTDQLDVLVNNAGIGIFDSLEAVTIETFDLTMTTNVKGTFFLTQALVPLMRDGSRIVNVSSSLTRHPSPATSVYTASKAAIESLTRSLAVELGVRGIRVNSLAPGPTATDFNGGAMRDDPDLRDALAAATALGRVGEPAEIGEAVAALASEEMRWVTGERIEVSGGSFL